MLKMLIVICLLFIAGKIFAQVDSALFAYEFLHVQLQPDTPLKFHYIDSYQYKEDPHAGRRGEDYQYIHNGDPFKGAQDVLTSSIDGAGWLKNFDFGKFASIIFEVRGDDYYKRNGAFDWTGKLIFIRLFHQKQIGRPRFKERLPE